MPKKKPEKSLDELLEEAIVKEGEQPYEVPGNWVWARLNDIGNYTNGKAFKPSQWSIQGLPIIRIQNLNNANAQFNFCNFDVPDKFKIEDGELLFAWSGTPGTSFGAHIWNGGSAVLNQHIFKVGFDEKVINRFFFKYSLNQVVDIFIKNAHGTAGLAHITKKKFENSYIPFPPLPEQKRIVKKLSSMLGKLKEARELIQEAKDTFEERRAAILNKAFTGELTKKWREENPDTESAEKLIEILIDQKNKQGKKGKIPTYEEMIIEEGAQPYNLPGNWEWVKIGYLLCEVAKKDPKREGIKKFTYLDISSIDNKAGRITDPKTYKGVEAPSRARQIVKTNDILFSTVRTYLKNIAVVDEIYNDQIASTGFCVMRCCGIINSRLLFRFVSSDIFINRLNRFQRGISYPAVKTSDLLEQPILLPPFSEQKEIIRMLEKLLNHEDEARTLIDMEEQIDLLEKSILSKAFRGELGTNDPDDEPAIELLKRSLKEKMNK